jgi:FixJ family two-component response regulator
VPKAPLISIVDDDEEVREATRGLVRSLGYAAEAFASASEFLASNRIHDTSCVITDLHMPGMSGIDLQDRLIVDGHRVPIIFITAFPEDRVRTRAMNAGAVCFMSKPYSEDHLINCLESALRGQNGGSAKR